MSSGGKEAQLAFYYQNLCTILKILVGLQEGKLLGVKIEQKIVNSEREIDITLEYTENRKEYTEVKSGITFTGKGPEIKESLLALFENFQSAPQSGEVAYALIINPDYLPPVARFTADIRRFKKNKTITSLFKEYCSETWGVTEEKIASFHEFIKILQIDQENSLETLRVKVLAEIKKVSDGVFINADHGIQTEELLNRLIEILIQSLTKENGKIDMRKFVGTIVEWCTRNKIASETHVTQSILDEKRSEVITILQVKFPSIAILSPSPSPSPAPEEEETNP